MILKINQLLMLAWISFSCTAQPLFDPTRPYKAQTRIKKSKPTHLELTSIFEVNQQFTAIINHQKVKVGSRIQGLKVKKIDENQVVLSNGQTLKLFKVVRIKE